MRAIVLATLASALAACAPPPPQPTTADVEAAALKSASAANLLADRLRAELTAAMQAGGPSAAIVVCRDRAPAIAAEIEEETGIDIERTALRVRNPLNAPDEWARAELQRFVERRAEGEDWSAMQASRVDGETLVWMRPIVMAETCAACHGGDEVSAETHAAIAAHYPNDAARGFAPGDLRGAFLATAPLKRSPID